MSYKCFVLLKITIRVLMFSGYRNTNVDILIRICWYLFCIRDVKSIWISFVVPISHRRIMSHLNGLTSFLALLPDYLIAPAILLFPLFSLNRSSLHSLFRFLDLLVVVRIHYFVQSFITIQFNPMCFQSYDLWSFSLNLNLSWVGLSFELIETAFNLSLGS